MKNIRPEVETNPYLYEDECDLPDEETLREIWGVDVDELSEEEKEMIRNRWKIEDIIILGYSEKGSFFVH